MSTAILVDAAFFLKRFRHVYPGLDAKSPEVVADTLYRMAMYHATDVSLYRILVYDCPPLEKKLHHPISRKSVDFSKLPGATFRVLFHDQLKRKRKVALRMGYLSGFNWTIKPLATKKLLNGSINPSQLAWSDVELDINQKGVDIKIGIDITALALKQLVKL